MVLYNVTKAIMKSFEDSRSIKFLDTGALRPPVPITSLRFPLNQTQEQIAHHKAYDIIDIMRIQSERGNYCPDTNALCVVYSRDYYEFLVNFINMRRDICIAGKTKEEILNQAKEARKRLKNDSNPNDKAIAEILILAGEAVEKFEHGRIRYYRANDELIAPLKSYMKSVIRGVRPDIKSNDLEIFLAAVDTAKQKDMKATIITGDPHFQHLHEFYTEHGLLRSDLYHPEIQVKMARREINKRRKKMQSLS